MEQKSDAQGGSPPSGQSQPLQLSENDRPEQTERVDSAPLPGHLKPSITDVPVTPGIGVQTYESENDDTPAGAQPDHEYFSKKDVDHALAASPKPVDKNQPAQVQIEAGANAGKDFLNRLGRTAMGSRQESLSDIRAKYPSLSLSGNIISATFTVPYGLRYRKGADWVSNWSASMECQCSKNDVCKSPTRVSCDSRTAC